MVTFISIKNWGDAGLVKTRKGRGRHHCFSEWVGEGTVSCCSVNQLLRQHSEQTAASFLYLPVPPHGDEAVIYPTYLQLLTELTADLPPTVLVHGVSPVTSTTL
jgi:hypothetical protein